MFNVAVLRMKDILKYLVGIIVIMTIIFFATRGFAKIDENKELTNNILSANLTSCLETAIPVISSTNGEEEKQINIEASSLYEDILKSQIGAIEDYTEADNTLAENNNNQSEQTASDEQSNDTENIELAQTGQETEVITNNPIASNYNVQYGNVKIKNQTSYELTDDILNPNITIENKNILLFHTHTCESYTSSEKYQYEQTGNFRTTDLNFTVARVGDELETQLKQYNYNVIHDKTYHDYPSYNGSYTNSLKTVENILQTNSCDIIFDIHRDAVGSRSDYAPIVKIGDTDVAAQIMFVIGTNEGGLWHPNWQQNLKFAIKVQEKAEEMYPGLFKPIMLTKYRYNQHAGKYASIIEVGATGNTLEQCTTSMKYLAKVLDEVLK